MKILHVILSLRGGGAERFVSQLIESQIRNGIDATACIFQRSAIDPFWCRNIPPPMELEYTPKQGWWGPIAARTLVKQFRTLVEKQKYEIIHTHLWPACRIVARATRGLRARHVWHVHDMPDWLEGASFAAYARRVQMRHLARCSRPLFIACSEAARRLTRSGLRLHQKEIVTVTNGIDVMEFSPVKATCSNAGPKVRIIMTSAFRPLKGHSCLVDAAELMRSRGLSFGIVLAGDTDSDTGRAIREAVKRRRLTDLIRFAGHVADVPAALRASDIFVLPSESEALGLSIVEAMACGLPVVATNVGGIPEIILEGKTGFLVSPRNAYALASKLSELVKSQPLRIRMGLQGVERARSCHSFNTCAEKVLSAYDSFFGVGRVDKICYQERIS
jgi:glycosyltransferase involved in cell wall biosynthesis